jgi:hypothetical protein
MTWYVVGRAAALFTLVTYHHGDGPEYAVMYGHKDWPSHCYWMVPS